MILKKLTVLGLVAVLFAALPPSTANAKPCQGTATGKWDLPSPLSANPGLVLGELISYGYLLYEMEGELVATNLSATEGTIEAKLTSQQSWLPDAKLEGKWVITGSNGEGEFKAVIKIPGWPDGWMKGKFKDDNPPNNSGEFKAEFQVC